MSEQNSNGHKPVDWGAIAVSLPEEKPAPWIPPVLRSVGVFSFGIPRSEAKDKIRLVENALPHFMQDSRARNSA